QPARCRGQFLDARPHLALDQREHLGQLGVPPGRVDAHTGIALRALRLNECSMPLACGILVRCVANQSVRAVESGRKWPPAFVRAWAGKAVAELASSV